MTKREYLDTLYNELSFLPPEERGEQIRYFAARLDSVAEEELEALFGTPQEAAEKVFNRRARENADQSAPKTDAFSGAQSRTDTRSGEGHTNYSGHPNRPNRPDTDRNSGSALKTVLTVLAVIVCLPFALAAGVFALALVCAAIVAAAIIIGGAIAVFGVGVYGVTQCVSMPAADMLYNGGIGLLMAGAGAAAIWFIPQLIIKGLIMLIRGITDLLSRAFHRGGGRG